MGYNGPDLGYGSRASGVDRIKNSVAVEFDMKQSYSYNDPNGTQNF